MKIQPILYRVSHKKVSLFEKLPIKICLIYIYFLVLETQSSRLKIHVYKKSWTNIEIKLTFFGDEN